MGSESLPSYISKLIEVEKANDSSQIYSLFFLRWKLEMTKLKGLTP